MLFGNQKRKRSKSLQQNTKLNYYSRTPSTKNIPFIDDDSQGVIIHTSGSRKKRDDVVNKVPNNMEVQRSIIPPRIILEPNVVVPRTSDPSTTSINLVKLLLTSKHIISCIADQFLHVHKFPPREKWSKMSRHIKENLKLSNAYNKIIRGVCWSESVPEV